MTPSPHSTRWRKTGAVSATLLALAAGLLIAPATASAAPTVPSEPVVTTAGTTWKYLDDGSDPAAGNPNLRVWTTAGFDDSAWKSAKGSFGAKRGKLEAVGPHTPTVLLNHYLDGKAAPSVPTYFFRTSFTLPAGVAAQAESVVGTLIHDDAAAVWINGTKVAGFLDERATGTTNQEYAGTSNGDPVSSDFAAPATTLIDGENTIAVALYQDRETSSDIYLEVPKISLVVAGEETPGAAAPSRVILTPTTTPTTSQSFSWFAGDTSHDRGQVQIKTAPDGAVRTVDAYNAGAVNGDPKLHFSATVTGLTPATKYSYRVGVENGWSPWHTFSTANPADKDFQFVYYGDAQIGLDTTWPSVVRQAEKVATRSIGSLHAGDLIDKGNNETQWNNWFLGMENSAATTNVMAAPGNHEYSGDKLLKAWKANFEYPHNSPSIATVGDLASRAVGNSDVAKQYASYFAHWTDFAKETVYFTDYQDVRFIALNATRDKAFLTPDTLPTCDGTECPALNVQELWTEFQAAWLDHTLETSPSKWNVVTFHQPVFSTSAGRDEPVLRKHWVPVFQKHNIDLVLMGHDHTYARGFINDDATDIAGMTDGPVYVVSNSGAKHYSLETDEKNVWTNNGATQVLRGAGVTTFQVIDVKDDQLVYRSYLAEKTDKATTELPIGAVYDEFTVTKRGTSKWVTEVGVSAPQPETTPEPTPQPTAPGSEIPADDKAGDSEPASSAGKPKHSNASSLPRTGGDVSSVVLAGSLMLGLAITAAVAARHRKRVAQRSLTQG